MIPFLCNLQKMQIHRDRKLTSGDQGLEREDVEKRLLTGTRLLLG